MAVPHTAATLRDSLDREGCAYGQVTRERIDNALGRLERMEAKLNVLLGGVLLQLMGFVFGLLLFVLGHVRLS